MPRPPVPKSFGWDKIKVCSIMLAQIEESMPTISEFFGIMILMFFDDHAPPHFHARYGGDAVVIQINPIGVLRGKFPPRALSLVIEWAGFVAQMPPLREAS